MNSEIRLEHQNPDKALQLATNFDFLIKKCAFSSFSNSGNGGCVSISNANTIFIEESTFNGSTSSIDGGGIYATGLKLIVCFCVFSEDSARVGFGLSAYCTDLNTISNNVFVKCRGTNTELSDGAWISRYGWTVSELNNGSQITCRGRGACFVSGSGLCSHEVKFDMYTSNDAVWVFGLACLVNESEQCISNVCLANNTAKESVYLWYGNFRVKNSIFSDSI